jgi:PRTRC genetic system protein F
MAPGTALAVPRLALGALEPFQPSNTYSGAFGLARNLLLAGVGHPEDWEVARGDPVAFMLRTVERDVASFNRKAIDGVAHVDILFGTSPYISSWHEKEYENPDRVFLAVEATQISIVYLRPTLELLAKVHPRLPATFYRTLLEGVSSWILSYDESACEAFYEWRLEAYEEAKESGEEGLEKPQSIETAKGLWLTRRYKPLPATKANAVIEALKPRTQARAILDAIRRLHTLAKARERTRPYCDMWDEYYPNGSFSVPFTILAFHEQDLVCQAFQSDEEDWMNGGEQQSPAFATAFSADNPFSIANGFEEFRHFLRMMEALGELLALLPGCDVLEEQK